jgi:hypothetical protein
MTLCTAIKTELNRPAGKGLGALLVLLLCTTPGWLFFNPMASVVRDPLRIYRLRNDDFEYVARSRTLPRALENLFVPHNTHILPAWRLLTWGVTACAGNLSRLPVVLAVAAYAILVAVMLLTGWLVARESGSAFLGLSAMTAVGTSSLMWSAATWYSAGQTLWAGLGILATLFFLQSWRNGRRRRALILACASAVAAGSMWTVGHLAGPIGAIYLWVDGRPQCRKAAMIPLGVSVLAVALGLVLVGRRIDATTNLHGRSTREAVSPVRGALHTIQAIPENLVLGNLGLAGITTQAQATLLSAALALVWLRSHAPEWRFNPLECAGGALALGTYFGEYSLRGYLSFELIRVIVPWYDAVPQIGLVLFVMGWITGRRQGSDPGKAVGALTRGHVLAIACLAIGLVALNRPRVDARWAETVPRLTDWEAKKFRLPEHRTMRNTIVALSRADWQREHLLKLDLAETRARQLGVGRDAIHRVYGRVDAPGLPPEYDALGLLALPRAGRVEDPATILRVLRPYLSLNPEPRPSWLPDQERWPPD